MLIDLRHRPKGASPASMNIPHWQRWLGFWLVNIGQWLAGYHWGYNAYMAGAHDMRELMENDDSPD